LVIVVVHPLRTSGSSRRRSIRLNRNIVGRALHSGTGVATPIWARRQGRKPHQFFLDLLTKNNVQAQTALYRSNLPANPTHQGESKKPP
jgi:hypothetical protein